LAPKTRESSDQIAKLNLSGYVDKNEETPAISLECVMKAAGLIEQMGCERLKPRKEKE
jgi:hypothetical protein